MSIDWELYLLLKFMHKLCFGVRVHIKNFNFFFKLTTAFYTLFELLVQKFLWLEKIPHVKIINVLLNKSL